MSETYQEKGGIPDLFRAVHANDIPSSIKATMDAYIFSEFRGWRKLAGTCQK
jgi:hypothetical protein